jgi:hypothetical protein
VLAVTRMADKHQAAFKSWVPQAARQKISELRAIPNLTESDRRLLDRLANYPVMRTEVWEKLPLSAKRAEDFIVGWVFYAAQFGAAYRPPLPRRRGQIPEYLRKYPPILTPEIALDRALMLVDAMKTTNHYAKEAWPSLWSGDRRVTFEEAVSIVENLATFYRRLDEKDKEFLAMVSIPDIRKKNARNAPEWLFARLLADHFQRRFGNTLDSIVAALSAVVFDQDTGVGSSTIRGRRRSAPGAAHSSKNSQ